MKKFLISRKQIEVSGNEDMPESDCEKVCDAIDSIDFESIIQQKIDETGVENVTITTKD